MIIGLVGAPSSGKSTFFKAATLIDVDIADYPFTTIEPNEGFAYVRVDCACNNFEEKCNPIHVKVKRNEKCIRFVPVKILDVAGLVPGAHLGKGMGNKFMDDLIKADILIHIIDASKEEETTWLEEEINKWFSNIVIKHYEATKSRALREKKDFAAELAEILSGISIKYEHIVQAMSDNAQEFAINLRKISKPILNVANKMDLPNSKNIENAIPASAEIELALRKADEEKLIDYTPGDSMFKIHDESKLNEKQKKALEFTRNYLNKHKNTGVQRALNKAVFEILEHIEVYPVQNGLKDGSGNILPDTFLLKKESTALNLAEKIHTDIAKNFKKAIDAKTKRPIGKDHKLKQGDIISIIT